MKFDTSQADFQRLSKLVQHSPESLVPFIGAGMSIYGPENHRLPLWSQLVEILLDKGKSRGLINNETEVQIKDLLRKNQQITAIDRFCLLYTSPSPRDLSTSRMPSSA